MSEERLPMFSLGVFLGVPANPVHESMKRLGAPKG
jgi:hypothetical protein